MSKRRVGTIEIGMKLVQSGFKADIAKTQSLLRQLGGRFKTVGSQMSSGISAPLAVVGVATTKFANDFNKSMANVSTLLDGDSRSVTKRVEKLKSEIQNLAISSGKSTGDLSDGLYQVVSAFGDSTDSVKKLAIATQAGIAGLASTADAINLLSAVTKGYGDTSIAATKQVADFAFQTVKLGQTTFPELASSMGQVIPIAASLNVQQKELWGTMSTLTGVTGNTSEAVTQVRSAMVAMLNPTKQLSGIYDDLGISSGEALVKQYGFVGGLKEITASAEKAGLPLAKVLGRVEAMTAALSLSGPQAEIVAQKIQAMSKASGASELAFKRQSEGVSKFAFQLQQLQQRVIVSFQKIGDAISNAIGDDIVNSLNSVGIAVDGVISWFQSLSAELQKASIAAAAFATALGPLIAGLGILIKFMGGTFILQIVAVTAAFSALGAAFVLFKDDIIRTFTTISTFFSDWSKEVNYYIIAIREALAPLSDIVAGVLSEVQAAFVGTAHTITNAIIDMADVVWDTLASLARNAVAVMSVVANATRGISPGLASTAEVASAALAQWQVAAAGVKQRLSEIEKQQIALKKHQADNLATAKSTERVSIKIKALRDAYKAGTLSLTEFLTRKREYRDAAVLTEEATSRTTRVTDELARSFQRVAESSSETTDIIGDLSKELSDIRSASAVREIEEALTQAVKVGSLRGVDASLPDLKQKLYEAHVGANEDAYEKAGSQSAQIADEIFNEQWKARVSDIYEDTNQSLLESQKRVYEEGINFWQKTFENAITGVKFDLEDTLTQVAVGFAAQVANGVLGAPSGQNSSPQGFGSGLGQMFLGELGLGGGGGGGILGGGGGGTSLFDSFSAFSNGFGGEYLPGAAGTGTETAYNSASLGSDASAYSGFADVLGYAAGAYFSYEGVDKIRNYNELEDDTGSKGWNIAGGMLSLIGTAVGAVFGDGIGAGIGGGIGDMLGDRLADLFEAPMHQETQGRYDIITGLNKMLAGREGIQWVEGGQSRYLGELDKARFVHGFDPGYQYGQIPAEILHSEDYREYVSNLPEWAEYGEETYGTDTFLQFDAIGQAIGGLEGKGAEVGSQVGFYLMKNFEGSLEGLRELINVLGLDLETLETQFVSMGMTGDMTWHEVEVAMQSAEKAVGPGLVAVGAVEDAFKGLISTGGMGVEAIQRMKNIFIEAKEAGITTFDELRERLTASGEFTEEEINALFGSMAQRGIESFDELLEVTDRVAGGIIADMESLGIGFETVRSEMEEIKETMAELEGVQDITKKIHFEVTADFSDDAKTALKHAELDLPLQEGGSTDDNLRSLRSGSGMGIYGDYSINGFSTSDVGTAQTRRAETVGAKVNTFNISIDAKGAGSGVRDEIMQALESVEHDLKSQMSDIAYSIGG